MKEELLSLDSKEEGKEVEPEASETPETKA
jgi:hypothetical protein